MTKNFNRTVYVLQNRTTLFVDNTPCSGFLKSRRPSTQYGIFNI